MDHAACMSIREIVKFLTAAMFGAGLVLLLLCQQSFLLSGEDRNDVKLTTPLLQRQMIKDTNPAILPPRNSDGLSEMYGNNISYAERRKTEEENKVVVEDLVKMWTLVYGLTNDEPPLQIERRGGWIEGQDYPVAPHLEDCERLTNIRKASEMREPGGESQKWLFPKHFSRGVDPPWVKGLDKENLPMTRYMQTLLWKHQHPRKCNDPSLKFAIFPWRLRTSSGLGSALHVMSVVFATVMTSGRILVPLPGSFERSAHAGCTGSHYGSLDCYFFPFVSPECEKEAMYLWKQNNQTGAKFLKRTDIRTQIKELLNSEARVVAILDNSFLGALKYQSWVPSEIGEPWATGVENVEILGNITDHTLDEEYRRAGWWHAQSMRYMLRWPSKKLCHAINRVRQESYGKNVAQRIVRSLRRQNEVLRLAQDGDPDEAKILENIRISSNSLESYSWADEEPYIPRPIVSVHVRQGDKKTEMRLFNFPSFMYLAERLRRHVPDLKTVWLSTEMQSIVEETSNYPTWDFLFTNNLRQKGNTSMRSYEQSVGIDKLILLSFANLLIAGECDYFVGVLGSNWNRLINELRLTNGKLNAGIVALNYGES